ncbi:MAG: T9SS type A sorting domain-containing protein, partial [candidate division KSB1 bacterium]|nr:T9SS type A sorting domain-containing protein [candidate division KSB1 bacterium]
MKQKLVTVGALFLCLVAPALAVDFFFPFMQKAAAPVVIDGDLDDWNFCFPIDVNQAVIPENSRCHDWYPEDDYDLSGTIKLMWDENYLYVSAYVRDDIPGVLPQPPSWNADAVEIYLGNYNVGRVPWDPNPPGGVPDNDDGKFACQLAFYYDATADTGRIYQYTPIGKFIKTAGSVIKGKVWPNNEGYTLEARVAWADIASAKGNGFHFKGGEIVPFTLSLYDRDDWDRDDFQGYAFSERAYPAWAGPSKGWQVIEVKPARESQYYLHSSPYLKQAAGAVFVDGVLDEWNYCFPVDMNQSSIPEYSRAWAWFPEDNTDLSSALKFMYDDKYLYVGASVMDDVPGVNPVPGDWNADAIEIYIGNYEIDDYGVIPDHSGYINQDGMLDVQLGFYYNADTRDAYIKLWNPGDRAGLVPMTESYAVAKEWPTGDGYDYEAALSLKELASMVDDAGVRTFDFISLQGAIVPCTYALYDRDEWNRDDFQGYQYVRNENAPYMGPGGGGWEGVEIVPKNLYDVLGRLWENYTDVSKKDIVPAQSRLLQNYPNPFNPSTTIEFELSRPEYVTLKVFDLTGREVATLVQGHLSAGQHSVQFNPENLGNGVYLYQLKA